MILLAKYLIFFSRHYRSCLYLQVMICSRHQLINLTMQKDCCKMYLLFFKKNYTLYYYSARSV